MHIYANLAVQKANSIVKKYETRNPNYLANELGITVMQLPFSKQKGAYKVIERNRFIFIKEDLHPTMKSIVLLHEIGHDQLHRKNAVNTSGFIEFNIFDMGNVRMEYEANIFAASILLPDNEILEYIYTGYDVYQIASVMNSDINLVALKIAYLNSKGYNLKEQNFQYEFLR